MVDFNILFSFGSDKTNKTCKVWTLKLPVLVMEHILYGIEYKSCETLCIPDKLSVKGGRAGSIASPNKKRQLLLAEDLTDGTLGDKI